MFINPAFTMPDNNNNKFNRTLLLFVQVPNIYKKKL